ncbi:L,D-transpeptidase [Marilutibacter spongiae]|uniref:L,D-transpeptidase n=1 Tax=Marilutibacter spongiae TaxID=2025720 RepID=A0A7W3Y678_9GAMM|nr:L,D-transpeptidase [Lysobacter spongiae]MBB1060809.1 L,D-transpeptidase [Lysobacter spongiae]
MLRHLALALLLTASAGEAEASTPFWGDKESQARTIPASALQPGQFVWSPELAPAGPIVVVVSLNEQLAYAYRNGVLIGYTTISTGKKGHQTPTGVFTTLQKDKDHRSSIYNNAAMPYTQRLTWGGVALHAGGLPGYPSSHGCVHLPSVFAEKLFEVSPLGMTVVVADESSAPQEVNHPGALAPVHPISGEKIEIPPLYTGEVYRWQPELATEGPISILLSTADRRVLVYRNGVEIGRTRMVFRDAHRPLGSHVYTVVGTQQPDAEGRMPAGYEPDWTAVSVPGLEGEAGSKMKPEEVERVVLPPAFVAAATPYLAPGTTLMVTDAPILPSTTGVEMTVVDNAPPDDSSTEDGE